jgi:hypothetical protein
MGFGIQPSEFSEYGPFLRGSPGEGKHPRAWFSAGSDLTLVRLFG